MAVPADHALAGRPAAELAEFGDGPWICGTPGTSCHDWLCFTLRSQQAEPVIAHTANEYATQLALVAAGLGIAVMPRLGREPVPAGVRLIAVTPALCRRIYAAWRDASARRPAIAATVTALRAAAAGAREWGSSHDRRGRKAGLMGFSAKARRLPGRLAAGAFILNAGLGKWSADEETAARLHGTAAGSYPFLSRVKPKDFARLLAVGEIALGSALLVPVVPPAAAGAGLTAFSAGLLGLYARTPGMRKEDGIRPTQQGTPLAKDVWMLGIGLGLIVDALTDRPAKQD